MAYAMPAKRLVSPGEMRVWRTLQGRVGDALQITSGLVVAKLRKRSSKRMKSLTPVTMCACLRDPMGLRSPPRGALIPALD